MAYSRPAGLGLTFLVGGLLLVLLTVLFLWLVPCVTCPKCRGTVEIEGLAIWPCGLCGVEGKVSVFRDVHFSEIVNLELISKKFKGCSWPLNHLQRAR